MGLILIIRYPNWNLALDRIESLSETAHKFKSSETDWEEYFFDLVGVTRPESGNLQGIVLKFSPEVAPYVITKPIHPSQKHKNDPTGLEVKIKVIPNFELERLILSFRRTSQGNFSTGFQRTYFSASQVSRSFLLSVGKIQALLVFCLGFAYRQ